MAGFNQATFALVIVVAVCAFAAVTNNPTTTHKPTTTKEPREYDTYTFIYNHRTHHLILRKDERPNRHWTDRLCYLGTLSAQEQVAVHTAIGMKSLELTMLSRLDSAVEVHVGNLTTRDHNTCGVPRNGTLRAFTLHL